ncbi:MAG: alpha-E domain-containing protein, partial [Methylococcaceae bacterium]|jgi:uncharacterized alpha-E superfamily protein|nr:alpha-E domain-containing protein [Methylococcaceae bacterium]
MYRQQMRSRVKGDDVLNFLLLDTSLPRSVGCCIAEMSNCIGRLPNSDKLPLKLVELQTYVQAIDTRQTTQQQLRGILDGLQNKLGELHGQIADNWFLSAAGE